MGGRSLKVLGGLAAAILIGAIGSGVWEALLKPLLQYGAELVVWLSSWMSATFKDGVYREAAEGFHEKHSLVVITFMYGVMAGTTAGLVFIGPLRGWLMNKMQTKPKTLAPTPDVTKQKLFLSGVGILGIVALGMFITARESYINRIATWSLTSIECLNASITPSEYATLKAKYYRVSNANDFYEFHSQLTKTAKEKGIGLREFDPL